MGLRSFARTAALAAAAAVWLLASAAEAADPCLIFVHGKRDGASGPSYATARDYWRSSSDDFIPTATAGSSAASYVAAYHGDVPYWDPQAAGAVAAQIVDAAAGLPDGGGQTCTSKANGGRFWVVAHSMGGNVMDYILGNARPSDPNYDPVFLAASTSIDLVVAVSGSHRGSELADAVCSGGGFFCNLAASLFQDCSTTNFWLRSDSAVQVANHAGRPARNIYLTGGYEAIFGPSVCLSGEDDGVVQYASQFACAGDPTTGYDNDDVCGEGAKQESGGFFNLDGSHENHLDTAVDNDRDTRRAIPDGYWECGGSPCSPDSVVQSNMSSAQLVQTLVTTGFGKPKRRGCGLGFEVALLVPLLGALRRRRR